MNVTAQIGTSALTKKGFVDIEFPRQLFRPARYSPGGKRFKYPHLQQRADAREMGRLLS